jgi:hypothetical protein
MVGYQPSLNATASGPFLPFIATSDAALRLHQTSHSCDAQHFGWSKVGCADFAVIHFSHLADAASLCACGKPIAALLFMSPMRPLYHCV